jgi:hypothetical protein
MLERTAGIVLPRRMRHVLERMYGCVVRVMEEGSRQGDVT